jgi:hypothetical protein
MSEATEIYKFVKIDDDGFEINVDLCMQDGEGGYLLDSQNCMTLRYDTLGRRFARDIAEQVAKYWAKRHECEWGPNY